MVLSPATWEWTPKVPSRFGGDAASAPGWRNELSDGSHHRHRGHPGVHLAEHPCPINPTT